MRLRDGAKWTIGIAGFLGADAWTIGMFIWSLYDGPKRFVGPLEIHPPAFLLLACLVVSFSIVFPVVFFRNAIRLWRPKNRFQALHGEIKTVIYVVESTLDNYEMGHMWMSPNSKMQLLTVTSKLDQLKIRHPELNELRQWQKILPYFASWAKMGDLESARSYRPGMEKEFGL